MAASNPKPVPAPVTRTFFSAVFAMSSDSSQDPRPTPRTESESVRDDCDRSSKLSAAHSGDLDLWLHGEPASGPRTSLTPQVTGGNSQKPGLSIVEFECQNCGRALLASKT